MEPLWVFRNRVWRCSGAAALAVTLAVVTAALAAEPCLNTCGDLDGDGEVGVADFSAFVACMGQSPDSSPECLCADMQGSGTIDLHDFALFAALFEQTSDEQPPECTGTAGTTANLTAYRPQHGAGYAPFTRTAVAEADEESANLGPGIRINAPGDVDPAGEDDLIEVTLSVAPPGAQTALRRSTTAIVVWATRDRQPGTEIAFVDNRTDALPLGPAQTELTLWVEWASAGHGTAVLDVEPLASQVPKDALEFHTFQSIVVALGGEDQVPSDPASPTAGTFAVATNLYRAGYDVHMYDEDNVAADGTGATFNEVANAIQHRGVANVAIFGYSHGGGSTYSLSDLLDISRPTLGVFEVQFSSYVDAVRNNSDLDVAQELRRPPSSLYHVNQYQHGVFFQDLGLDGGPVPSSNPPPTGLDVETTPWGDGATHFEIDDFVDVRDLIEASLEAMLTPEERAIAMKSLDGTHSGRFPATGRWPRSQLLMPLILLIGPGSAFGDDQSVLSADPAVQAAITSVLTADSEQQQSDAIEHLRVLDDTARQRLVRQLVYYSRHAQSEQDALAAGAIIRRLNIPDSAVIQALVPLLGTPDSELERLVRNILGGFEERGAGRRPNFSAYLELIANTVREGNEPPDALIRYMYESDPGEALLTLMRSFQLRQPAALKQLLWAEHVVSDVLWKQRYGFLDPDEIEPAAAEELAKLAGHEAWWARLYVAEIMRQHTAFRQPALVELLKHDTHRSVREAIYAAEREK
jgi:hypothetical protein